MSAVISDKVMMKEVLKATGFDCPQGNSLVISSSTAFSYFYVVPTGTNKTGSLNVTEGSLGNVDRNNYICIFRDSSYNTLIGMGRWRDYEALTN